MEGITAVSPALTAVPTIELASSVLDSEWEAVKTRTIGMAMNTTGRITIVTTIKRFRRYSRSSFWKMPPLPAHGAEPHLPFSSACSSISSR